MTSETTASDTTYATYVNLPWMKGWNAAASQSFSAGWSASLNILADRLQNEAGFVRQLSQCSDPVVALQLNATFVQQSLKDLWDDNAAILEVLYSKFTSAASTR